MIGLDFGGRRDSPYMKRQDRAFPRTGGRPVGSTGEGASGSLPTGTPTGSGIQSSQGQSPYAGFLKGLTEPIGTPYESQFKERAGLLRSYTMGAYKTAAEGMKAQMGGKGFRMGESGIADTAIGRIQKAGAEELTRGYKGLAAEEGRLEQQYKMGAKGLDLQRQLGGAGIALRGEEGALDRMMEYYRSKLGAETAEFQPWWQGVASGY